jgi:hypothetical protein
MNDNAFCGGVNTYPIVLHPDRLLGETLEVGSKVILSVTITPEVDWHRSKRFAADKLSWLTRLREVLGRFVIKNGFDCTYMFNGVSSFCIGDINIHT